MKVAQLCPTLCNPTDCSLPDSSVHGILQARILEWVVIPFSRGFSQPRNQIGVSCIAGGFFTSWATMEAPRFPIFKVPNNTKRCVCVCVCVCVSRISMLMGWFNHILSSPIHPTSLQIFVLHFPCVGYSARFGEHSSKTEQNPASMEFTFCGGWRLRTYSAYHSASHLICQTEKLLEESACLQMPPLIITSPAAAGSLCSFQNSLSPPILSDACPALRQW